MDNKIFKIEILIPEKRLTDLFIGAIEGGSSYWCKKVEAKDASKGFYSGLFNGFTCIDSNKPNITRHISPKLIQQGLKIFAEKYPRHFGDFISDDGSDDAETADVFFQCVVLQEVIYG